MKPFKDKPNNPRRVRHFNYTLSATRAVIENANARLKNKFQRLKFINIRSVERARLIIRACIILHNFIIEHDTAVDREETARDRRNLPVGNNPIAKRDAISHYIFRERNDM